MLSQTVKDGLNKSNDWVSAKNKLGDLVHKNMNCVKGSYKFSRDGGAVGDINLKDQDGVSTLVIPSGAVILNAFVHVTTALTSGGSATIDLNSQAANDLLAAEAVASFSSGAKIQGVPDFGTLADAVVTTADKTLSLSINTAALTAGELSVYVFYVF
jgi:hypothetical protein